MPDNTTLGVVKYSYEYIMGCCNSNSWADNNSLCGADL